MAHAPRLLFVGLLDEVKGVQVLLRAFARVHAAHPGARLDIVGDGPRRGEYEALASELGVAAAVRFHGALTRDAIAPMMREADLLVLPSRTETFGIVVVEALACGLPVVATRVGALPELVDSAAGVLVDPADPVALADGIAAALAGLNRVRSAGARSADTRALRARRDRRPLARRLPHGARRRLTAQRVLPTRNFTTLSATLRCIAPS